MNVLNERSFRTKSGHGPDVLNFLGERPFVIFRAPPNARAFRTPDQDTERSFMIFTIRASVATRLRNPGKSTDATTLGAG